MPKEAKVHSWPLAQQPTPIVWEIDDDPIIVLSNEVNGLTRAGKFDQAETACRRLIEKFPDDVSGLRRAAQLEEARGNLDKAVDLYFLARDFAATHDGFDAEVIARYDGEARRVERRLKQLRADQKQARESGSTAQEPAP